MLLVKIIMNASFVFMGFYAVVGRTLRPALAVIVEYSIRMLIN